MSAVLVLAEVPALPLNEAGKYVAAAYIVLVVIILIYVSIMAIRLSRLERELGELLELSGAPKPEEPGPAALTAQQESTPA
jgi:hypothetical protein